MDGIISVSSRDKILREIVSNLLAHRDFSSAYVAKFIIEKDKILTENSNRSNGLGNLDIESFEPFPKNPPISKVFREIGLADELGSGMRNTYKYTKLYSGAEPQFIEGNVFKTIIPLSPVATAKVGPEGNDQDSDQVTDQVSDQVVFDKIVAFCTVPKTKKEICSYLGYSNLTYFSRNYLKPLLENGRLAMTLPDKPKSKNQKYIKS